MGERGEFDRPEGGASDGVVDGDPEGDAEGAREQAGGQVRDEERDDGLAWGGAEGAQDGVVAGAVVGGERGGDDGVDDGEADEEGGDGEPEGARPVQVREGGRERDQVRVVRVQGYARHALPVDGLDAGAHREAGDHHGVPMVSPNVVAMNRPGRRVAARSPVRSAGVAAAWW